MLGEDIVDSVKIVQNHCNEKENLIKVGHSKYGCDAYLNKDYVASDFKIVTGFIEPHFFAGFLVDLKESCLASLVLKPFKHFIMQNDW